MAAKVNAFGDVLAKAGKDFGDAVTAAWTGTKVNGTRKAVNNIGNFTGGIEAVGKVVGGEDIKSALNSTFRHQTGENAGKLNYGKIAGSYIGAAAAGRIVTGGGAYKDGNGNSNLIGVPFV